MANRKFPTEAAKSRQCAGCNRIILRAGIASFVLKSFLCEWSKKQGSKADLVRFVEGLAEHLDICELPDLKDSPLCAECKPKEELAIQPASVVADLQTRKMELAEQFYLDPAYLKHERVSVELIEERLAKVASQAAPQALEGRVRPC